VKWLLVLLVGCVSLPHIPAEPRGYAERERAAVRVDMACSVAGIPGWEDEPHYDDWTIGHIGSGVVLDERHVLTAAHVVRCPTIPGVMLTTFDGRHIQAVVTHEDQAADVAVLELATADRLHLDVAPPARARVAIGDAVCAETSDPARQTYCGVVEYVGDDVARAAFTAIRGNSGAPVYDAQGRLVGLVTKAAKDGSAMAWFTTRLP
jgi:S1-C subfamily serine protease